MNVKSLDQLKDKYYEQSLEAKKTFRAQYTLTLG